ncbi:hypothetical protein MCUN1_003112 [Malassezia cuniculi]|uniref:Pre-mRNA processing factor 4 (PRP4)-like domain-containing protein n=1 Tax=Malassezia cuniculi TaxID=948313 RepID=A0AAF0EW32_9BASI|nr:hypothetical protein MCUN1_003112 [Malassezia cuniculi]
MEDVSLDELVNVQRASVLPGAAAHAAALEARQAERQVTVPTSDRRVKELLRSFGAPITYFGEAPADRRARLRDLIVARGQPVAPLAEEESDESDEEFYTEGSAALLSARRRIAESSLRSAKRRAALQRAEAAVPLATAASVRRSVLDPLKEYTSLGSQLAGERPISAVRFSPDGSMLATGSWSGKAALWSMPNATQLGTLHGHEDRVTGLAWHPQATISQSRGGVNLATGGGEGSLCLWSLESERPVRQLTGHEARVARVAFHPLGDYLASASFDGTWRLWDVEAGRELLTQEGHSKEVYAVDFQGDGALVASGGLDAIGRVWDCRTGRTAMVLDGHAREILSVAFAPNGYQLATASGDDTVRIWDLRRLRSIYTIPAHRSSVSDVRYYQGSSTVDGLSTCGLFFATSGYDGLVKVWSAGDWQLVRTLAGDAGKVMSVDIARDGTIASGEWARTFKVRICKRCADQLWGPL